MMLSKVKFKQKQSTLSRSFFRKGGGELIVFMCIIPTVILIVLIFTCMIQQASIKQRLEHAVYVACRAAIAQENGEDAYWSALFAGQDDIMGTSFQGSQNSILDVENAKVELSVIDGKGKELGSYTEKKHKDKSGTKVWKKGNYVTCTLSVPMDSYIDLFDGVKTVSLTMMIERPVELDITGIWEG